MSCLIFFIAKRMSASLMLTYVPGKRAEVHSEHKLSTSSPSSRNEVFPQGPEPARLPVHFQLCGGREGQGQSFPNMPSLQPKGRVRPQHSWGMEGQSGINGQSGIRALHLGGWQCLLGREAHASCRLSVWKSLGTCGSITQH